MKILTHNQTKHGMRNHPLYNIWGGMIARCEIKSKGNFKYYGGRGIKVCEEWRLNPKSFFDWALNNGYKKGLEIDRIDVNGDYAPNNCQFVTHRTNCQKNKRRLRVTNKSGERNICISKSGTYESYASVAGMQIYIKSFKTIEEAIIARDSAEKIGSVFDNPKL
ncbi:hypothetical protein SAMN05192529_102123 [Arachidicoccus rhizosphaerae]|uniref:AP2 domain-containing protein n=1 Tax=Arachidicoccus rhizosphaerae TaxID=551991 RepID=A0A1H3W6M0_9BACT|nr:hypothetical protein [Arachidicoccus rhizosphaerae]SDZ81938.1 hypothetical protein SAMN05192529_102123 [Arachidicoccus rhizosphaerae]